MAWCLYLVNYWQYSFLIQNKEAFASATENGWRGAVPFDLYPNISKEVICGLEAINPTEEDTLIFKQAELWGLLDIEGKLICAAQYEEIHFPENGYYPFKKSGKWGLLSPEGKELIAPLFEETRGFSSSHAACKQGGFWGCINTSGDWVIEPIYEELGELRDGLMAAQKGGLFGFIGENGETKIDFQFQDVLDFTDGVCLVFENEFVYPINMEGKCCGERYTRIFGPDAHMLIHVMKDDKWGIIKPNGELLLPVIFDLPRAMGQVIQVITEDRIPIKKGPLLGYADMSGKEVVPPKYVTIDAYCEGLSLVSIPHGRLGLDTTPEMMESRGSISGVFQFGFIDKEGQETIPLKYTKAHRFEYGLAFVQTENTASGYITYDGTEYFED